MVKVDSKRDKKKSLSGKLKRSNHGYQIPQTCFSKQYEVSASIQKVVHSTDYFVYQRLAIFQFYFSLTIS
jgi:hypothetical protein